MSRKISDPDESLGGLTDVDRPDQLVLGKRGNKARPAVADSTDNLSEETITNVRSPTPDQEITSFKISLGNTDASGDIELDHSHPLLRKGTMVSDYRIEGVLGQGGMGTVYAAVHPIIGKKAAIKVLRRRHFDSPRAVERFIQEARSVNQIGHRNIVDIFSFGTLDDGSCYLIMEWLEGETLATCAERGRVSFDHATSYLDQICKALEAAHEKGIIHRDLKPDNVFLVRQKDEMPMVKLLDFGIAKQTATSAMRSTETGMVMGTPAYVAPEQAKGKQVSDKTDVYSLGCIFYELFLGRLPFQAESAVEVVSMHLYAQPVHPCTAISGFPQPLGDLMVRMLAKDAEIRPSVSEVRRVLRSLSPHTFAQMPPASGSSQSLVPLAAPPTTNPAMLVGAPTTITGGGIVPQTSEHAALNPAYTTGIPEVPEPDRDTGSSPRRIVALLAALLLLAGAAVFAVLQATGESDKGSSAAENQRPTSMAAADVDTPATMSAAGEGKLTNTESPVAEVDDRAGAKATGQLVVVTNVDDASIQIGGKSVQVSKGRGSAEVVLGDKVDVKVSASGYQTTEESAVVNKDGQTLKVTLEESKQDVTKRSVTRKRPGRQGRTGRTRAKQSSTSGRNQGTSRDGTIDPFKD